MGLPGPSNPVRVEPLVLPAPARKDRPSEPAPAEKPKTPTKEPVPA